MGGPEPEDEAGLEPLVGREEIVGVLGALCRSDVLAVRLVSRTLLDFVVPAVTV